MGAQKGAWAKAAALGAMLVAPVMAGGEAKPTVTITSTKYLEFGACQTLCHQKEGIMTKAAGFGGDHGDPKGQGNGYQHGATGQDHGSENGSKGLDHAGQGNGYNHGGQSNGYNHAGQSNEHGSQGNGYNHGGQSNDFGHGDPGFNHGGQGHDEHGIVTKAHGGYGHEAFVTLTLPLCQEEATTSTHYPDCDDCLGTVFCYEPTSAQYVTSTTHHHYPVPTIKTIEPECDHCTGTVVICEPDPTDGFPHYHATNSPAKEKHALPTFTVGPGTETRTIMHPTGHDGKPAEGATAVACLVGEGKGPAAETITLPGPGPYTPVITVQPTHGSGPIVIVAPEATEATEDSKPTKAPKDPKDPEATEATEAALPTYTVGPGSETRTVLYPTGRDGKPAKGATPIAALVGEGKTPKTVTLPGDAPYRPLATVAPTRGNNPVIIVGPESASQEDGKPGKTGNGKYNTGSKRPGSDDDDDDDDDDDESSRGGHHGGHHGGKDSEGGRGQRPTGNDNNNNNNNNWNGNGGGPKPFNPWLPNPATNPQNPWLPNPSTTFPNPGLVCPAKQGPSGVQEGRYYAPRTGTIASLEPGYLGSALPLTVNTGDDAFDATTSPDRSAVNIKGFLYACQAGNYRVETPGLNGALYVWTGSQAIFNFRASQLSCHDLHPQPTVSRCLSPRGKCSEEENPWI
jgi:hypothetical protein